MNPETSKPLVSLRSLLNRRVVIRHSFALPGVLGVFLASCAGDTASLPYIMRDSAGVTIVESAEAQWIDGHGWTLSEQPVVTIGLEDGPEEYSLFRVVAALRVPGGDILVADAGADQLRYYDSTGVFLYSVGRDGFGPGEFKRMNGVWIAGDSIVVNDFGQDRMSIFSASGEHGRTLMLQREAGASLIGGVGVFSDGTMLSRQGIYDSENTSESGLEFTRRFAVYRRHSREGELLDSLGVFLWSEGLSEPLNRRTDPATGVAYQSAVFSEAPFGRSATTIAFGNSLYHGSSDSYEIRVFSKRGSLERIIRRPIPNPPVTHGDRDRFREYWLEENGEWGRRRWLDLEYPDTKPAYGPIIVDALGCLWVAGYSFGLNDGSGNWTVFDQGGRMLGVVQIPVGGRYISIGEDYVIGRWRTAMDVEEVRMYRLFRN